MVRLVLASLWLPGWSRRGRAVFARGLDARVLVVELASQCPNKLVYKSPRHGKLVCVEIIGEVVVGGRLTKMRKLVCKNPQSLLFRTLKKPRVELHDVGAGGQRMVETNDPAAVHGRKNDQRSRDARELLEGGKREPRQQLREKIAPLGVFF